MTNLTNRQIVLRRRPQGLVQPGDTEAVSAPAPEPADGEALVRTTYLGIDAAVRTWLDDKPGYLPPVGLGEVIRAGGVGEVVATRCDAYIAGARVVGIAGGPEKCRVVEEEFGFDACIDHRAGDLPARLKEHCPERVHVYFDNVGGPILDAVLGRLAHGGRVALCGVISSYLTGEHPGPANYVNLLARSGTMAGFNTLDRWDRFEEALAALRGWEASGRLVHREHVLDGLVHAVDALNGLFTGANIGKTVVKVADPTP